MSIKHRPVTNTKKAEELYSKKDGVPVKYVCTTGRGSSVEFGDVFYRGTPHPEFGNRYFILFYREHTLQIGDSDWVEDEEFVMVEVNGEYHYSRGRHDFYTVGDVSIDGGRAYTRLVGNASHPTKTFKVKDGGFVTVGEKDE